MPVKFFGFAGRKNCQYHLHKRVGSYFAERSTRRFDPPAYAGGTDKFDMPLLTRFQPIEMR